MTLTDLTGHLPKNQQTNEILIKNAKYVQGISSRSSKFRRTTNVKNMKIYNLFTLSLSEFVSLRSSSDATSEMGEGNTSLSVDNSLKISLGIFKVHSLDCSDNFEGILEVNSEISCRGLNSCDQNKNELAFCFIMFSIRSRAMAGLFACCVVQLPLA